MVKKIIRPIHTSLGHKTFVLTPRAVGTNYVIFFLWLIQTKDVSRATRQKLQQLVLFVVPCNDYWPYKRTTYAENTLKYLYLFEINTNCLLFLCLYEFGGIAVSD